MSELSLYAISKSFNEIMLNDDLSEEEKTQGMNMLAEMITNKSEEVIGLEKNMEFVINAMKQEEERIKENRKSLEAKLERYKGYIMSCMNTLGVEKLEAPRGTIAIQTNPMSVEIVDEYKIPNKYKKQVIETKIDKDMIKRDFKNTGELIEGVKFVTDKKSLRFK